MKTSIYIHFDADFSHHASRLRSAKTGAEAEKIISDLESDKTMTVPRLKEYIQQHTTGKVALGKTRSALIREIHQDWVRNARFENKIARDHIVRISLP